MEIPPANAKLREAEFFFMMMENSFEAYEFPYFVSAFLSALFSCTEHNRLHSPDVRFKGWYQHAKVSYLSNGALQRLTELRNKEIHHRGTESVQRASLPFPNGIESRKLELELDFSGSPQEFVKTVKCLGF